MPQTDCDSFVRYQAKEVLLVFMLKSEIHYLTFLEYALAPVQMRISDPLQKKGMSQKVIHETPGYSQYISTHKDNIQNAL